MNYGIYTAEKSTDLKRKFQVMNSQKTKKKKKKIGSGEHWTETVKFSLKNNEILRD